MKRAASLVAYSSSEDEADEALPEPQIQPKRRKLPPLSSKLTVPTPVDIPALHQGRIRSTPHVEGQWASYVFVPLKVAKGSALEKLLRQVFDKAQQEVPILHSIGLNGSNDDGGELRISLTRPIYLRAHQRDEFKRSIRQIAKQSSPFVGSFTSFAELVNDERTRSFLTIEIGAGHKELSSICDALNPVLRGYRQKPFYDEPRFHASVAWALLSKDASEDISSRQPPGIEAEDTLEPRSTSLPTLPPENRYLGQQADLDGSEPLIEDFPAIPGFPSTLIQALQGQFAASLRSKTTGIFDIEYICVKIGKDIVRWRLGMQ